MRRSASTSSLALVEAIRHLESKPVRLEEPRIERLGLQRFVGLPELVAHGNTQTVAGRWQRFMSGVYGEIENKTPTVPIGITTQSGEDGIHYVRAAEISRFGRIPTGLVKLTLQPQAHLLFSHNGHITGVREAYTAIWDSWLPASGRTAIDSPSLDRHNEGFDPRTGNGGVTIWIPIEV